MPVVRFKRTHRTPTGTVPHTGTILFEPTNYAVVTGAPNETVSTKPFSMNLDASGVAQPTLAETTTQWVWKVTEWLDDLMARTYYVKVPASASTIDDDTLIRVDPKDFQVAVPGSTIETRLSNLESGGVGGGGAVSSVNAKTGDVVLSATDVGAAPASHTHPANQISDSTPVGRAVVTAADAAGARAAIGAGTSDLALGTTGTTAAAGNHTHNASDVNAGTFAVARLGSGVAAAGKYVDGGTGAWTALPSGGMPAMPVGASGTKEIINPGVGATFSIGDAAATPLWQYYMPSARTYSSITVEITTAGAAGSTLQFGYYTLSGTTFTLTVLGTVAADSTGQKTITGPFTIPAGPLWWTLKPSTTGMSYRGVTGAPLGTIGPMPNYSASMEKTFGMAIRGKNGTPASFLTTEMQQWILDTWPVPAMIGTLA